MKTTALQRFEEELRKWVKAHNDHHGYDAQADNLLTALEDRIGIDLLGQIGSGYLNGWLVNETGPGRGYLVKESDRPGPNGGQYTLTHDGGGKVAPCWELYVQLGDYAHIRTVAERLGQEVRLEDRLMDLTVYSDDKLILYVEQKREESLARSLLKKLEAYGRQGFSLEDPDKGNDALRKAKYLVRHAARPLFLGLSAPGFRRLFQVEYGDVGNQFGLIPVGESLTAPLADYPSTGSGSAPPRSPIDALASEVEAHCEEIWLTRGTGQTAFNFYSPSPTGDAIIAGVYEDGTVWTDLAGLGEPRAGELVGGLAKIGISLKSGAEWRYWREGDGRFNLTGSDPVAIVGAFRAALDAQ